MSEIKEDIYKRYRKVTKNLPQFQMDFWNDKIITESEFKNNLDFRGRDFRNLIVSAFCSGFWKGIELMDDNIKRTIKRINRSKMMTGSAKVCKIRELEKLRGFK